MRVVQKLLKELGEKRFHGGFEEREALSCPRSLPSTFQELPEAGRALRTTESKYCLLHSVFPRAVIGVLGGSHSRLAYKDME